MMNPSDLEENSREDMQIRITIVRTIVSLEEGLLLDLCDHHVLDHRMLNHLHGLIHLIIAPHHRACHNEIAKQFEINLTRVLYFFVNKTVIFYWRKLPFMSH